MNNLNLDTVGIDSVIELIKNDLYEVLSTKWSGDIDAYGRIFKNINTKGQFKPEIYIGNGEYKEVFINDEVSCTFFFMVNDKDNTEDELVFVSGTKIIFMLNLDTIYPSKTGREDERARVDVVSTLRNYSFDRYEIKGIQKELKNVFSGLDTSQMKYSDIHPYHCFAIDIDLSYYLTEKCE